MRLRSKSNLISIAILAPLLSAIMLVTIQFVQKQLTLSQINKMKASSYESQMYIMKYLEKVKVIP